MLKQIDQIMANRSTHVTSSFLIPTQGESNSDIVFAETSDKGSIDRSREYDKKIFEVVEIVEQDIDDVAYNNLRKSNQKKLLHVEQSKEVEGKMENLSRIPNIEETKIQKEELNTISNSKK